MDQTFQTVLFALVLLWGPAAGADVPYKCPERIATGSNILVSIRTGVILKQIYLALGCSTEFIPLPLNRGVQSFNNRKVDGEVLRIPAVEKHYKVPFVRSAKPMFNLINGVWSHPDMDIRSRRPLGYVHGVLWQVAFVTGRSSLKFYSEDDMFRAYSKGLLGGFLSSDFTVNARVSKGSIIPLPVQTEVVNSLALHHYIHKDFASFMAAFSTYIEDHKPFTEISSLPALSAIRQE